MGSACSCCGNKHTPVAPVPKPPVSKTPVPQKHRSPTPHRAVEKPARAKAPPAPVPIEQYTKAGITTNNPLKLIEGYKDEPLVSLEEALKPFDGHITDLPDHIDDAKNDCRYPSEHKLTRDESAAIFIYSQQWQGVSVNDHLQAAWASNDRAQLKPWFKFLMLLRSALGKLPNAKAMVWQGAPHDEELKETLRSKSKPIYTSMGSASPSEYAIKEHLHETSGPKTIMIGYRSVNGKDVTGYTASRAKEVIIRPGCKLGVAKYSEVDDNGSLVVHLVRETDLDELQQIKLTSDQKHFVCPKADCGHHCRGNHPQNHCFGFSFANRNATHQCGPPPKCSSCKKPITNLRECNKCHQRFCEPCCFK